MQSQRMVDAQQAEQLMAQMIALRNTGRLAEAASVCRIITRLVPTSAAAFANLANLLLDLGDADAAIEAARTAVALEPAFHGAHATLATALVERGDASHAMKHFDQAIRLAPNQPKLRSSKIYAMEFLPGVTPEELLSEQREWNRLHGSAIAIYPFTPVTSGGRIKIGYVSSFFFHHAEAFFVLPLIESHDRSVFEIHCYSDVHAPDEITSRHRAAADHWHDCRHLSNDQLADLIHQNEIEILVDLMIHMGRNRAPMFARKPAPIQIVWLAYPGGTGLSAMDYRITDPIIDPPGNDALYAEKSIRLPGCWCCYDPLCDAAPVPTRPDRPITFGSLNNPRKLNESCVRLWASAMKTAPDSRMIILSISGHQRGQILMIFAAMGVSPDRIEFVGRLNRSDYLRQYDRIDIALDSLPYAGITTTCDSLWMGVPVITLAGNTAAGRAGASVVTAAGFPQFAAHGVDQFITTVARLANDPDRLCTIRSTLRQQCIESPLMNRQQFARDFECALVSVTPTNI